jgi:biopolymer transport protein ExbD
VKLNRPKKRQHPETIIPLIDVVFFLLIFFMLIGRMDATAPFEVTPANASTGSSMPGGGATLSISAKGEIALDGVILNTSDMLKNLQVTLTTTPTTFIRVNAHKDAELRFVLPIISQIEALGARSIELVVTPLATP